PLAVRYVSRMGGRCTPFGLFAGTAPVGIGTERDLALADRSAHEVRVRADVEPIETVIRQWATEHPATCPVRLNPTTRRFGDAFRFSKPGDAHSAVVQLTASAAVTAAVEACRAGATSRAAVVAALRGLGSATPE